MSLPQDVFSQSSLVPIAKIASASTRLQRIIWVIISTAMFIGLCSCITLVIIQYCMHQTVFQLDYSGRLTVYDQIPGITICPEAEEIKRILNHAARELGWTRMNGKSQQEKTPWLLPHINKELLKMIQSTEGLDPPGAIAHFLPVGNLYWDTHKVAKSPIYRALHNYTVTFRIKPANIANNYRLFVLEQRVYEYADMKHIFPTEKKRSFFRTEEAELGNFSAL
ncbi:unnamed protein product [Rodentolepis nana]|uniref:Integral membrane protein 2 n=1 Tax=Rodentolepis nana TaxID=102285 RepID=A0A0R3T8D2_RODNA|nr:unnamed protein product [Rodentolepis nana]